MEKEGSGQPLKGAPKRKRRRGLRTPEFGASALFGKTLEVTGKNLGPLVLLAFVIYLPGFVYMHLEMERMGTAIERADEMGRRPDATFQDRMEANRRAAAAVDDMRLARSLITVGGYTLAFLLQGCVTALVFGQLRGQRTGPFAGLVRGLKSFFPVIGTGLSVAFIVALLSVLPELPDRTRRGILPVLVSLALFVPLVYVSLSLFVSVQVAAVERCGPFTAIGRSWTLTKGRKLSIFGGLLFLGFAYGGVQLIIAGVLGEVRSMSDVRLQLWFGIAFVVILGMLVAVMSAVAYHDLRLRKDGIPRDELLAVFD
ncbi:MAG: hypothetical protein QNJ98_02910 [Planctomycetota bacterium]|nr:hypothetical protein [Planctomycetota bacterium]